MLTADMARIIRTYSAGMVATVNGDGSPAVSPKGTFVVIDHNHIGFGNIRSPGTLANLRRNARVEACFLDVLARKAVRIAGTAEIVDVAAASDDIRSRFQEAWAEYLPHMTELVVITIDSADLILSPAYDFGHTEEDLTTAYRSKLANT